LENLTIRGTFPSFLFLLEFEKLFFFVVLGAPSIRYKNNRFPRPSGRRWLSAAGCGGTSVGLDFGFGPLKVIYKT
jgi:hypothetical protein